MDKMTTVLVHQFYPILKAVSKIKDKNCKRKILQSLGKDPTFAKCMKEISENVLKGSVPLSVKDKKQLNKHAKVIRNLKRAKGISQAGGFLNIVLPLLATVVADLIAKK